LSAFISGNACIPVPGISQIAEAAPGRRRANRPRMNAEERRFGETGSGEIFGSMTFIHALRRVGKRESSNVAFGV
jgi:hypothetical protein